MAAERSSRDDGDLAFDGAVQRVTVEKLNPVTRDKGFVFAVHSSGKEVFLHRTASFDSAEDFDALVEGSVVECRIKDTHKGWRAVYAQLVG